MTICLSIMCSIFLTTTLNVQANDNQDTTILPSEGVGTILNSTEVIIPHQEDYPIYNHNGKKTYMSYTAITDTTSNQYELQSIAYTDEEGFRKVGNRYCVAIGTAFNAEVGQCFDVVLSNGEIINCIVGDIKADQDTDSTHVFTSQGCCLEFIVDDQDLNSVVKKMGDCSYLCDSWQSPCIQYSVYDIFKI